ncbi:MAG: hypothetical protein GY754_08240 [bacterium]|nr:hypothetical protein [bacterium]
MNNNIFRSIFKIPAILFIAVSLLFAGCELEDGGGNNSGDTISPTAEANPV